jgi:acetyl-CoA decarbonylase/synthase complex subunit gamma
MAFSMKVAQGGAEITKCPYVEADVLEKIAESTAPPMKSLAVKLGADEGKIGGETVLFRHEKTFVSKTLYAFTLNASDSDEAIDAAIKQNVSVDYTRIGERMYAEFAHVSSPDGTNLTPLAVKAAALGRGVIVSTRNYDAAKSAVAAIADSKPILNGADKDNFEQFSALATEHGILLGVNAPNLEEMYELVEKLEKLGNKNLVLTVDTGNIKTAYEMVVQIRRTALMGGDRVFGYPTIVNVAGLTGGDPALQSALASLFTVKYGSILLLDKMDYATALPLYGLRQNLFTDPQKPMRQEVGIYPMNKGAENDPCFVTVDFALTYFVVSAELERSGVPLNLLICDAGGYSVLTSWAAGKFSASSIAKFVTEEVESKIKSRTLVLPGKVAVLKGELEAKLPDWKILVGPNEAVALVKYARELVGA